MELTREFIKSLPKAELHCHLDGSMRVETIMDLAKKNKVDLPENDPEKLRQILEVDNNCKSLTEYLRPFDITCSVLQTKDALERATYELAEDCATENVRYLEIRFSPILHVENGLSLSKVVEAVLDGKNRAEKDFDIIVGIIICGLRHLSPEQPTYLPNCALLIKIMVL